jgi:hypothetical protein
MMWHPRRCLQLLMKAISELHDLVAMAIVSDTINMFALLPRECFVRGSNAVHVKRSSLKVCPLMRFCISGFTGDLL